MKDFFSYVPSFKNNVKFGIWIGGYKKFLLKKATP